MLAVDAGLASGHGWCPVKPDTFESTLVANVHVIGDACIAGAMPKSASAAHSQALQCARAIVASLREQELPPPEFDSVCYSLLGRDRALVDPWPLRGCRWRDSPSRCRDTARRRRPTRRRKRQQASAVVRPDRGRIVRKPDVQSMLPAA